MNPVAKLVFFLVACVCLLPTKLAFVHGEDDEKRRTRPKNQRVAQWGRPRLLGFWQRRQLEQKVKQVPEDLQIVITSEETLLSTKNYTTKLFNDWQMGNPTLNYHGILIFVSLPENRIEIEFADALGYFMDSTWCQEMLITKVVPYFRKKKYFWGLQNAVEEIRKLLENSVATKWRGRRQKHRSWLTWLGLGGLAYMKRDVILENVGANHDDKGGGGSPPPWLQPWHALKQWRKKRQGKEQHRSQQKKTEKQKARSAYGSNTEETQSARLSSGSAPVESVIGVMGMLQHPHSIPKYRTVIVHHGFSTPHSTRPPMHVPPSTSSEEVPAARQPEPVLLQSGQPETTKKPVDPVKTILSQSKQARKENPTTADDPCAEKLVHKIDHTTTNRKASSGWGGGANWAPAPSKASGKGGGATWSSVEDRSFDGSSGKGGGASW